MRRRSQINRREGDMVYFPGSKIRFGDYHMKGKSPSLRIKRGNHYIDVDIHDFAYMIYGSDIKELTLEDGRIVA